MYSNNKNTKTKPPVSLSKNHIFLKGPIPLRWLETASRLGGKCLDVGITIWFLAGLKRSNTFNLTPKVLSRFGVGRGAAARCLSKLEQAGLINANKHRGRRPVVTLLKRGNINELTN